MVPGTGIEPVRLSAPDFKSGMSTNFITRALAGNMIKTAASPLYRQDFPLKQEGECTCIPLFIWSGKRVSNSRPQPWQGCALPTELFPQQPGGASRSRTDLHGFAIRCITALLSRRINFSKTTAETKKAARLFWETGAGNESRTRDLNLGKVALYQLSYSRESEGAL